MIPNLIYLVNDFDCFLSFCKLINMLYLNTMKGVDMNDINPIAFTLFGLDIRWYGILIASSVLIGIFLASIRAPRHGVKSEDVLDVIIWSIPFGIIGARLYYVIFNWNCYSGDLMSIINIREGGLAIHGGLILGTITALIVSTIKRINFLDMVDLLIPEVALAQAIGRWGNFFNGEAYGRETNLPWAIIVDGRHVHPTFLYESIWCLLLFFILIYISGRRKFPGQIVLIYGMLYSIERFFVEELRTDSLMLHGLKQAQLISVLIFAISFILYFYNIRVKNNSPRRRRRHR